MELMKLRGRPCYVSKSAIPGLFLLFLVFSAINTILYVKNDPSIIRCPDLNSRPQRYESPYISTRPWRQFFVRCCSIASSRRSRSPRRTPTGFWTTFAAVGQRLQYSSGTYSPTPSSKLYNLMISLY